MSRSSTMDLTEGKPLRLIAAFGLPLLINVLFQQLYSVADSIIVGRLIGVKAFASLGSAGAYYGLALNFVIGFAQGFGMLLAQRFGAKDYPGLRRAAAQSVLLTAALGAAASVLFLLLLRPALRLTQTPADILPDAYAYVSLMLPALTATFAYNTAVSVLYALGNSRAPLVSAVAASIANIALDLAFVGGLHMGVRGIAFATICATLCSLGYCLLELRRIPLIRLQRRDFSADTATAKALLRLGWPLALRGLVIAAGGIVMQTVINGYGTPFVAGLSAANKYFGVINIIGSVMEGSIAMFVAQNYGAANLDGIKEGMRQVRRIAVVSSLVIGALTVVFGRSLIGLFITGSAAGAAVAMEAGYHTLAAFAVCLLPLYMLLIHRAALQGLGNSTIPMLSGFTELGLRMVSVLLLRIWIGEWSVYYASSIGWIGAAALVMWGYAVVYSRRAESAVWNGREAKAAALPDDPADI